MEDMDLTVPPRRHEEPVEFDVTMPGKRDRKPDGRFDIGDLIMKRYKVLAELGQGGMGVVYKCFDETAGIEVALKALPPELSHNTLEMEDIKDNFQLVHNLHHPNIASSNNLEKDNSNGNYYLIMECCEGEDLRRWLRRKRKEGEITLNDILPVVKQVADALDYAHKMKIIHRDIKPGNIMINAAGEIKVLDFGLAAQIHTSMTRVSMAYYGTSGTGPYMAPEQWEGRLQDAKADQYALAVMTYEMLAGHPPFESTDAAVLREAVLKSTVPQLENVPKSAEAAILRAMSKNPAERFENCSDFAAALGGKKVKAANIQKSGGFPKWAVILLVAVLVIGAGIAIFSKGTGQNVEPAPQPITPQIVEPPPVVPLPVDHTPVDDNERKITALVQETYRLQARVSNKKQDIESENHDRGQTFGKYLDALKENFRAGELAMKNNDVTSANASFKTADKIADWIIESAPLRRKAKQLQNEVQNQKSAADRFEASKLAYSTYKDASNLVIRANNDYESGKFSSASQLLNSALSSYKTAYDEARKVTAENFVDLAKKSKRTSDWQKVYDYAKKAFDIDDSIAEAKNLMVEAENHLKPTLEIIAMVDGKRVPATVKFGIQSEKTYNNIFRNLQENRRYRGSLSYQAGEAEYVGDIAFTCNWRGPKKMTVALKKQEFTKIDCNGVVLEMVKIKAGSFTMGSSSGEQGHDNDETQHRVTLTRDYWLGKFEVTQAQWKAVMGNNPSYFKSDDRPVEQVSWNDAKEFCNKLNTIYAGKLPAGYKFDLPTEAQWEYACRAGTTTSLNIGEDMRIFGINNSPNLDKVGWYGGNCGQGFDLTSGYDISGWEEKQYSDQKGGTHPVGKKLPNKWGLYDMHGNVWEWCSDWYGSYNGDAVDPVGPSSGSDRVGRGGSWYGNARYCRSARRGCYSPGIRYDNLGFRLALVPSR